MTYTLLRLVYFGVAFGLLYVAGLRGWPLPIVTVVVALGASYLTLRKPRNAAAIWMADRAARRAADRAAAPKVDADSAHEDAQVDDELSTDR